MPARTIGRHEEQPRGRERRVDDRGSSRVRSGKPCFVGTRITVYDLLEYLAAGMTAEEIVADFPELTVEHVRAAIEFAALREKRLATA